MADQNQDAGPAPLDRRVLAIMATDVVGYSRQMEADEAGTIARVTSLPGRDRSSRCWSGTAAG